MGITQLKNYQVTSVKAYKTKETSRHEYLSVAVFDLHKRKPTNLIIERSRGEPTPNPSLSAVSQSIPVSGSFIAKDVISPTSGASVLNSSDELVMELNFEKVVYFFEVVVVAAVFHELKKEYQLFGDNCYRFVGVIMQVLQAEYRVLNIVEANAGMWCGVPIYSLAGGGDSVPLVHEKFKSNVKEFVSFVPNVKYLTFTYASWGIGGCGRKIGYAAFGGGECTAQRTD